MSTDYLTSRAQRLIEEFDESEDVRHGIAAVLKHLANAHDTYSDGEEFWHGVTTDTLDDLAAELTAPTLLDHAALAQPEPVAPRPLKERPDFIAGYTEGLADRKRITEHEEAELSPAAAAVYNAVLEICPAPADEIAAAALRAAADQVVPEDGDPIYGLTPARAERQVVRRKFLAIAAELEGQ
jgi:hypothetical protein